MARRGHFKGPVGGAFGSRGHRSEQPMSMAQTRREIGGLEFQLAGQKFNPDRRLVEKLVELKCRVQHERKPSEIWIETLRGHKSITGAESLRREALTNLVKYLHEVLSNQQEIDRFCMATPDAEIRELSMRAETWGKAATIEREEAGTKLAKLFLSLYKRAFDSGYRLPASMMKFR